MHVGLIVLGIVWTNKCLGFECICTARSIVGSWPVIVVLRHYHNTTTVVISFLASQYSETPSPFSRKAPRNSDVPSLTYRNITGTWELLPHLDITRGNAIVQKVPSAIWQVPVLPGSKRRVVEMKQELVHLMVHLNCDCSALSCCHLCHVPSIWLQMTYHRHKSEVSLPLFTSLIWTCLATQCYSPYCFL